MNFWLQFLSFFYYFFFLLLLFNNFVVAVVVFATSSYLLSSFVHFILFPFCCKIINRLSVEPEPEPEPASYKRYEKQNHSIYPYKATNSQIRNWMSSTLTVCVCVRNKTKNETKLSSKEVHTMIFRRKNDEWMDGWIDEQAEYLKYYVPSPFVCLCGPPF